MIVNILYILLAIFALGFIIFIHELGHYFMAKKEKMKIEVFAIGFGKPIIKWQRKDVKWQVGILPFGGYVRIAGMQKEDGKEPYQIKDGFFSKTPLQRIKVALMGPLVNLVFAFVAFSLIWSFGGREKPFAEFTKKIGFVDSKSELYANGVKAGDEIIELNGKKYTGFLDVLTTSVSKAEKVDIKGTKINYFENLKKPFDYSLSPYPNQMLGKDFSTIGILAPARYLIYKGENNKNSSNTSIEPNDRILWANGHILFSLDQLDNIVNSDFVYLTILRDGKTFQTNAPIAKVKDLKLTSLQKNKLQDLRYSNKMQADLEEIYTLSYDFNSQAIIKDSVNFFDNKPFENALSNIDLKKGDKIVAIGSEKVLDAKDLLNKIQNPKILMIVQKSKDFSNIIKDPNIDSVFDRNLDIGSLKVMVDSIGASEQITSLNGLYLLNPVEPKSLNELRSVNKMYNDQYLAMQDQIEKIKDPDQKNEALKALNHIENRKMLDFNLGELADRKIKYNPNPIKLFSDVFKDVFRTFKSLITGLISPKYLVGPVGILQVVKRSWSLGPLEGLYWMGFISLNLGIINLFPIPVLDGGHIVFSLFETVTKKKLKAKTMERLIIPFVVLLIGGAIFITFHDILRIVKGFF